MHADYSVPIEVDARSDDEMPELQEMSEDEEGSEEDEEDDEKEVEREPDDQFEDQLIADDKTDALNRRR